MTRHGTLKPPLHIFSYTPHHTTLHLFLSFFSFVFFEIATKMPPPPILPPKMSPKERAMLDQAIAEMKEIRRVRKVPPHKGVWMMWYKAKRIEREKKNRDQLDSKMALFALNDLMAIDTSSDERNCTSTLSECFKINVALSEKQPIPFGNKKNFFIIYIF